MKITHLWAPARQYAKFKDEKYTPTPQAFLDDTAQQQQLQQAVSAEEQLDTSPPGSDASSQTAHEELQQRGPESPAIQEKADPYLITFADTPFADPRQWSSWKKAKTVLQIIFIALQVTMASSISSAAVEGQMKEFGVVREVRNFLPNYLGCNISSSTRLPGCSTADCRLLSGLCARSSSLRPSLRTRWPSGCLRLHFGRLQYFRNWCCPGPECLDFDHLQVLLWYVDFAVKIVLQLLWLTTDPIMNR